jgi:hypothetical protein
MVGGLNRENLNSGAGAPDGRVGARPPDFHERTGGRRVMTQTSLHKTPNHARFELPECDLGISTPFLTSRTTGDSFIHRRLCRP